MKLSDLFSKWEMVRKQMVDAVRPLSQGQLDWLPEGGKNTVGDLLRHIAEVENWWFGMVVSGHTRLIEVNGENAPGMDSIFEALEKSHRLVTDILSEESTETWETKTYTMEEIETLTLRQIVWHVAEHEMRHRGQIFMMMRLQGIAPPNV